MKLDFGILHDPIEIDMGKGDPVKFYARWMTATERMRAVQLFNGNTMDRCMEFVFGLIQRVESIVDVKTGREIDISHTSIIPGCDSDVSVLDMALGRIPFVKQVELFGCLLAINGVDYRPIKLMLGEFLGEAELNRVESLLRPLSNAASDSRAASSPSS
mgnify:CR=1 FL=1